MHQLYPSYAMLNSGSMGLTIETPAGNEAACRLLESGMYGLWQYISDNKDDIYTKQLEFFRRGVENEDHRADMEKWYVDFQNQQLAADTWYTGPVGWAAQNGIASGTGAGFNPTGSVTREQIAVFLYNYAKAQGMDTGAGFALGRYKDANDVSPWAITAMDWATGHGYISGKADSRLDPAGTASRAEVAAILVRFLGK